MKKIFIPIIALITVISIAAISDAEKKKDIRIGFTQIEIQGDVSKNVADTVTEMIKVELLGYRHIKVIPLGTDRQAALRELEMHQLGIVDEDLKIDSGSFLGANKILQGKISKLTDAYYISLHIIDVKTGSYDIARKITVCSIQDLNEKSKQIIASLVKGIDDETAVQGADSEKCKSVEQFSAESSFNGIVTSESVQIPIKNIVASSVLYEPGFDHNPWVMTDDVLETAWVDGKQNMDAIGEWLHFAFYGKKTISTFAIVNGLGVVKGKWGNLYEANSSIKSAKLLYSNGESETVTFKKTNEVQSIALKKAKKINWIKLVIESEYPGTKYKDTCISEIKFFGK